MLEELLTATQTTDKRFVLYRRSDDSPVESRFATQNVSVVHRELPPNGPDPFLVIEEGGEFAGALALDDLTELLEPPVTRPGETPRKELPEGYRVLFDVLDETVFTALDRRQLLAVSREIEERAFRVGVGRLSVSFQTFSAFESQVDVYRHLATETDLDIAIHGVADWTPPEISGILYQEHPSDTIGQYWALAYDGGPEKHASGLLAREQTDSYTGFWTDDAGKVDEIMTALRDG